MAVVPGTSQGGLISIDDVLKNTSADDIILEGGAKFLIDNNLKIFNHAIHTISKFSDQLHLEPSADGLSLKALNSSKSAFASILFTRQFFSECDVVRIDANENNLCRISMRSALAIFGRIGVQATDRGQLSCKLQVDPRADYLIAQMAYMHFVTKCYVIPFRDCVVTYKHLFNDKTKLRNRLTLQARTLLTVLTQIGTDLDEVKIVATPDRFSIERFFTTDEDRARVRKTEATIDLDAFERYFLQHSSEVAVNLKELKAVLAFADTTGMSVNLHFDQPGRPIIVAVEENIDFAAEFVLATFEGNHYQFYNEAEAAEQMNDAPPPPVARGPSPASAVIGQQRHEDEPGDELEAVQLEEMIAKDGALSGISLAGPSNLANVDGRPTDVEESRIQPTKTMDDDVFVDDCFGTRYKMVTSQGAQMQASDQWYRKSVDVMENCANRTQNQIQNSCTIIGHITNPTARADNSMDDDAMTADLVAYAENLRGAENCVEKFESDFEAVEPQKATDKNCDELNEAANNKCGMANENEEICKPDRSIYDPAPLPPPTAPPTTTARALNSGAISSDNSSLRGQDVRRVVIDEDVDFELSTWNLNRKKLLTDEEEKSTGTDTNGGECRAPNEKVITLGESNEKTTTTIQGFGMEEEASNGTGSGENAPTGRGPIATSSPIYDCVNLSCSPSVYLDGKRPFNIRLDELELERLRQLNHEMPSQSQHDSVASTSFVGRLLDAAVEKTKPPESRRTSLASNTSLLVDGGEFAVASAVVDTPIYAESVLGTPLAEKRMDKDIFGSFSGSMADSPNPAELNRLENAVELLQSRFGGLREKPNTQQFSQEEAELAKNHNSKLFMGFPSRKPEQHHDKSLAEQRPVSRPRAIPKPNAVAGAHQQRRFAAKEAVVADRHALPKRFGGARVEDVGTNSKANISLATTTNTVSKSSAVVLSRPLAEIEREFRSDNSLDHSLHIDDGHNSSAASVVQIVDNAALLHSKSSKNPKPTKKANVEKLAVRNVGDLDDSGDGGWLNPSRPPVRTNTLGEPTTSNGGAKIRSGGGVETRRKKSELPPLPKSTQQRGRPSAAVITSSTSSVCVLEEDYGCDGGWLRKPNTQRGAAPPPKSTTRTASATKKKSTKNNSGGLGATDEELDSILSSVNNLTNAKNQRKAGGSRKAYHRACDDEEIAAENEGGESRTRKRSSTTTNDKSGAASSTSSSVLRPLRKKPTLAEELARRPSPPRRISPPSVVVLTSPSKQQRQQRGAKQ